MQSFIVKYKKKIPSLLMFSIPIYTDAGGVRSGINGNFYFRTEMIDFDEIKSLE